MIYINRDDQTNELVVRIGQKYADQPNPRSIVAELETEIRSFLVKEFVKIHGDNILNAIHASDISSGISDRIAEEIQKQFFKGKSE